MIHAHLRPFPQCCPRANVVTSFRFSRFLSLSCPPRLPNCGCLSRSACPHIPAHFHLSVIFIRRVPLPFCRHVPRLFQLQPWITFVNPGISAQFVIVLIVVPCLTRNNINLSEIGSGTCNEFCRSKATELIVLGPHFIRTRSPSSRTREGAVWVTKALHAWLHGIEPFPMTPVP